MRSPLSALPSRSFALFLIFFFLSLFAWSGSLHTSDGVAMYAVSDSLVRQGTWDIENIRWMGLQQGTFGPDGLLYSRKGVAVSIIALPLVFIGYYLGGIGPLHAATLLTPILHALTAVYLYRTVRLLMPDSGERPAILVAGLWAFGSMAFAYVKTWFSEPAVALAAIAALYHLLMWLEQRRLRSVLAVGMWLGFSLLTRSANAIVFPFYGLALLATFFSLVSTRFHPHVGTGSLLKQDNAAPTGFKTYLHAAPLILRSAFPAILTFVLPILISGLIYLWYNHLRFGNPFDSGYIEGEEFSAVWWQGLWGQTFSFGRGLVWYTPWVVLAVAGAWRWWRKEAMVVGVAWGSVIIYILVYGKWYLWSGGFAWGPRFLVPILPLLALMTAPIFEMGRRWRGAWWGLAGLGFGVNLIGVLYDFNLYQAWLDSLGMPLFAWESFVNPAYAQIPNLLQLGLQDFYNLDLGWVVNGDVAQSSALFVTLAVIVAINVGVGLRLYYRKANLMEQAGAGILAMLAVGWWLFQMYGAEQREVLQLPPTITGGTLPFLGETVAPDSQLWYDSPDLAPLVLNQTKGGWRITGFFVDGDTLDPETEPRATTLAAEAVSPIVLLSDGPDRAHHGLDRLLTEHLYWVDDIPVTTQGLTVSESSVETPYRLTEYWQGPLSDPIGYDADFTFEDGSTICLHSAQVTPIVSNGNILALLLQWQAKTTLPPTTQVFVQLTYPNGDPAMQKDMSLAQGILDVTTLNEGARITDRHALRVGPESPVANGVAPGTYTLHFGLYRYDTLERAVISSGGNEITIPIEIVE